MRAKDFGWCFIGSGGITKRVLPVYWIGLPANSSANKNP